MNLSTRIVMLVLLDALIVAVAVVTSYLQRFNGHIPPERYSEIVAFGAIAVVVFVGSLHLSKLYHRIWRYASIGELVSIVKSTLIGGIVAYGLMSLFLQRWMDLPVATRTLETVVLLIGGSRFVWRVFRDRYIAGEDTKKRRALIIGAGDCGSLIVKEMRTNRASEQLPVAFIDDDRSKQGLHIQGIPVIGGRELIADAVVQHRIDDVLIAMPSVSKQELSDIILTCKSTKAQLKMVPLLNEILEGKVGLRSIRSVQLEDLLGRDPVIVDLQGISSYIEGKTVLVTGAGGSIGSELCRQIAYFKPAKLLLLGHGENSIYQIETELERNTIRVPTEAIIADVQDQKRMDDVFRSHRPQVVFHAAAHKHVPLMEANPSEAIKNNVFGTKHVADCAHRYGAERFVLISSDKAVNPTSVMGVTKRIAEMVVQTMDKHSKTKFAAVRFGNVLGSRGSVVPRFKEQIAYGGPVTVTHPEMKRYFMTIPEAVQLVIQAGAYAEGGEVFILDMGQPVKINTLAETLIRFSGFEPHTDIKIEYTGIRPGEKLFEELLTDEEGSTSTSHDRISVGRPPHLDPPEMEFVLKRLERVLDEDQRTIREVLKTIVPSYQNVSYALEGWR